MEQQSSEVRIDVDCHVDTLRDDTRARARQSLVFFLESVLGIRLTPELQVALATLQKGRLLLEVAEGTALWYKVHGKKVKAAPIDHEAVAWLFPEVKG